MQFFESAIFALIVFIPFFFLVFFYLCYAWSNMHKRGERITIATILTSLVSFRILAIGFFILYIASLLLPKLADYIPFLNRIIPR